MFVNKTAILLLAFVGIYNLYVISIDEYGSQKVYYIVFDFRQHNESIFGKNKSSYSLC